jgi:hypothetical protein
LRSCIHYGGKLKSDCHVQTLATIWNVLIILVVEILAGAIVAVGNEILVMAKELLPDRSVKKGLVLIPGGNALMDSVVLEGLISVHNILA